jgi:hypothetical protein
MHRSKGEIRERSVVFGFLSIEFRGTVCLERAESGFETLADLNGDCVFEVWLSGITGPICVNVDHDEEVWNITSLKYPPPLGDRFVSLSKS